MAIKVKKRLLKIGYSHAITLPPAWVALYGMKSAEVTIIGSGDLLVIAPAGLERQAEELAAYLDSRVGAVTGQSKEGGIN